MALTDDFGGRSALVVGGTSGIGAAIAAHLHDLGADVVAAGLTSTGTAPAQGIRVEPLDLLRGDELEALVRRTSRLDILVNCAGVIRRELEYDPEVFRRVLEVNLVGTMRACVACHRLLRETSGCIVNIASMLSFSGDLEPRGTVPAREAWRSSPVHWRSLTRPKVSA